MKLIHLKIDLLFWKRENYYSSLESILTTFPRDWVKPIKAEYIAFNWVKRSDRRPDLLVKMVRIS